MSAVVLLVVLFSGVLPWGLVGAASIVGTSAWAMAALHVCDGSCAVAAELAAGLVSTSSGWRSGSVSIPRPQKLWWLDRLKGLLLALVLGYPLLVLVLKLVEWTGEWWWLWAWAVAAGLSTADGGAGAGPDPAAVQQVHAAAGRQPARTPAEAGRAHPVPRPEHPGHGRQQTVAALQRVLHRVRQVSEDRACSTR